MTLTDLKFSGMKKHSLENSDSTNGEMFNEVKNREIKWLTTIA